MSYDIRLKNKDTDETIYLEENHNFAGGTYALVGTQEAWINITYNYAEILYKVLGEGGIRSLYGKTAKESIPILEKAISKLDHNVTGNYWYASEGNVRKALKNVLELAKLAPADSVWDGD